MDKNIVEAAFEKIYGRVVGHDVVEYEGLELHLVNIHIMDLCRVDNRMTWEQQIDEMKAMIPSCSVLLPKPLSDNGFIVVVGSHEFASQESLDFAFKMLAKFLPKNR